MTQAFNLSQLANNLNTSGQLDATDGLTGAVPVANGGTGLTATPSNGQIDIGNGSGFSRTTLTAGSGIAITNGSGSITIATSGGGGVTSLNGQTGAVVTTDLGAIGSVISAVHAVSGSAITGAYITLNQNDTVAGSNLRYVWSIGSSNLGPFEVTNAVTSTTYNQGGTALSGTWRNMGRACGSVRYSAGCCYYRYWVPSLFVRIS